LKNSFTILNNKIVIYFSMNLCNIFKFLACFLPIGVSANIASRCNHGLITLNIIIKNIHISKQLLYYFWWIKIYMVFQLVYFFFYIILQ